jgi:hypothetical protein
MVSTDAQEALRLFRTQIREGRSKFFIPFGIARKLGIVRVRPSFTEAAP